MTYEKSMSSNEPGLFVILIDQSGSMKEPFGSSGRRVSKAEIVTVNVNRVLAELCLRNTKDVGGRPAVKPRIDISAIGYGNDERDDHAVRPVFPGALANKYVVTLPELAKNFIRLRDYQKEGSRDVTRMPEWIEPISVGATPMGTALKTAREVVNAWVTRHMTSFPPIVINFTDGAVTDVKPEELKLLAEQLKAISTGDGKLLLFKCHISSGKGKMCFLPANKEDVPSEEYAQLLFDISSNLPSKMVSLARGRGFTKASEMCRGFGYNVDVANFVHFLQIGTIGLASALG